MNKQYFAFIDGMRAIAVVSVIIYHLNPRLLPGGFSGVDIFFAISGFVVTKSLFSKEKSLKPFLISFYKGRFLRILPALFFMICITSLLVSVFTISGYLTNGIENTAKASIFGLSNFALMRNSLDYFAPVTEFNSFTHTWSLGVEEQFYFIYPLILYFAKSLLKSPKRIIGLFSLISILSIIYAFYNNRIEKEYVLAFYSIGTRLWELLLGGITFLSSHKLLKNKTVKLPIWGYFAFILLIYSLFIVKPHRFPYPEGAIPVFLTSFLMLNLVSGEDSRLLKILESRLFVSIGKLSYSLYLWHWPMITLFKWTIGLDTLFKTLFCLSLTACLSLFSYKVIETKTRYNNYLKHLKPKKFFLISAGIVVFLFIFVHLVFKYQSELSFSSVMKEKGKWFSHGDFSRETNYKNKCRGSSTESIKNSNGTLFKHFGIDCKSPLSKSIFVLGDSHAGSYRSLFKTLAADFGYTVYEAKHPGCSPFTFSSPVKSEMCLQNVMEFLGFVEKKAKVGDLLFLVSLKLDRFTDVWDTLIDDPKNYKMKVEGKKTLKAREEFVLLIKPLKKIGMDILVEAPKPVFFTPTYRCVDFFNKYNEICRFGFDVDKEFFLSYREPVLNQIRHIEDTGLISLWDPADLLCSKDKCSALIDGEPVFFDGDHLTELGNKMVYDSFIKAIH